MANISTIVGNATIPIDNYKPGLYLIKTEFTTYKFIK